MQAALCPGQITHRKSKTAGSAPDVSLLDHKLAIEPHKARAKEEEQHRVSLLKHELAEASLEDAVLLGAATVHSDHTAIKPQEARSKQQARSPPHSQTRPDTMQS